MNSKQARAKRYYQRHQEEIRSRCSSYYKKHRDEILARATARRYGLTTDEVVAILDSQGGKCAVCGTSRFDGRGPCVDHDHATGRVRGILCGRCNFSAGLLHDNPEVALALAIYLQGR